jgi:hypothetical protein
MSSAGDTVFVALNRGDSAQAAVGLPSGDYTNLLDGSTKSGSVTLPPRTAMLLVAN